MSLGNQKQQFEEQSYYEILGVEPTATKQEIRSAYKRVVRLYHPDTARHSGVRKPTSERVEVFKVFTEAYNTLLNDSARAAYDRKLAPNLRDWNSSFRDQKEQIKQARKRDFRAQSTFEKFGKLQQQSQRGFSSLNQKVLDASGGDWEERQKQMFEELQSEEIRAAKEEQRKKANAENAQRAAARTPLELHHQKHHVYQNTLSCDSRQAMYVKAAVFTLLGVVLILTTVILWIALS